MQPTEDGSNEEVASQYFDAQAEVQPSGNTEENENGDAEDKETEVAEENEIDDDEFEYYSECYSEYSEESFDWEIESQKLMQNIRVFIPILFKVIGSIVAGKGISHNIRSFRIL